MQLTENDFPTLRNSYDVLELDEPQAGCSFWPPNSTTAVTSASEINQSQAKSTSNNSSHHQASSLPSPGPRLTYMIEVANTNSVTLPLCEARLNAAATDHQYLLNRIHQFNNLVNYLVLQQWHRQRQNHNRKRDRRRVLNHRC